MIARWIVHYGHSLTRDFDNLTEAKKLAREYKGSKIIKVNWSYRFLASCDTSTCGYPIFTKNREEKVKPHCGKPAIAEVTETNGEKWVVCQKHLKAMLRFPEGDRP